MNILDLKIFVVNDIMIPRNEIYGIDINKEPLSLLEQIRSSNTRIPLFRDEIDDFIGILHLRQSARFMLLDNTAENSDSYNLNKRALESAGDIFYP